VHGGSGSYDWHPTWSPDSKGLAYQHGADCNSSTRSGSWISASLRLIGSDGNGDVALEKLNGGRMDNWRPLLSPFDSGGYFWVVYSAGRPYGNTLAGVTGKQQLWIAAIHDDPQNFGDPSEVPYYLDGQQPQTNLNAYWAPAPCQVYDGLCETDGQCCSNTCTAGKCGIPSTCHARGESCATDSDCCTNDVLECRGGLCEHPIIR
jgi:hypothetical protein